ncbi:MAG: murein peptide amidase A [Deltaproteobacteria bacterium]|nr:murein peptide amidase A [Deltaproteobacteria bacterium]
MEVLQVGQSVQGRPLEVFLVGTKPPFIHFYGGVHGDEPESVDLVCNLKKYLEKNTQKKFLRSILVFPNCNPDGSAMNQRMNAHGVDLNRNFPTKNWSKECKEMRYFPGERPGSEPEISILLGLIQAYPPEIIVSVHSLIPHQMNYDGPAKRLAYAMAQKNNYPVTDHIGYPTPGSLGEYAGRERKIAVITFELPEKIAPDVAWKSSLEAMLAAISFPAKDLTF